MNINKTVQQSIDESNAKAQAFNESIKDKPLMSGDNIKHALSLLWVFTYTSIGIWLKAIFTGKMSLKNIGLVLVVSVPIMFVGHCVALYIHMATGIFLFELGYTIIGLTVLLLLPVNFLKILVWCTIFSANNRESSADEFQRLERQKRYDEGNSW